MSDHGFKLFCRGVNLNSWLHLNGYLALKDGKMRSGEWFQDVDWSRTRAYGLGLGGIYINQEGREAQGIVKPGKDTQALKAELKQRLTGLVDKQAGDTAISGTTKYYQVQDQAQLVQALELVGSQVCK